jgi:hypothetical protein
VLNQDETPFLYSLVFGEGVVNDATSVVLFNAIQNISIGSISSANFLKFGGSFLYLFCSSTLLGVAVSSPASALSFATVSFTEVCYNCSLDFSVPMPSRNCTLAGLCFTHKTKCLFVPP